MGLSQDTYDKRRQWKDRLASLPRGGSEPKYDGVRKEVRSVMHDQRYDVHESVRELEDNFGG